MERHPSSQDTLICSFLRGPTSIICLERPGAVVEVSHVEISAQGAWVRWAIPWFVRILRFVVSIELTSCASEVFFTIQEEATISVTVERDTLVSVFQLKVTSPTPNDQITASETIWHCSFCAFSHTTICGVFCAIFPVLSLAHIRFRVRKTIWWIPSGLFVICGIAPLTVRLCVESVGAIVVVAHVVAHNWRFFEHVFTICIFSQIVFVVRDARVVWFSVICTVPSGVDWCRWSQLTITVAVAKA